MSRRGTPFAAALLAIVALAPLACRSRPAPAAAGRPVSDSLLLAAAGGDGWLSHGRDYGNTRFAPQAEINAGSVGRLARLWEFDARGSFRAGPKNESTPLVLDDLLIFTAASNLVLALDARTGAERWRYRPTLKPVALCCGLVNRGVAAYGDRIFLAAIDARVIALRRADGAVLWERELASPAEGYSFTMAPLAAAGRIIVGASGGEFGIRGFVEALDPATGASQWRFWTVPSPEEGGWWGRWRAATFDGDPLPRDLAREQRDSARWPDAWRRGGAPVWSTPAYDPAAGLLFVATGNPSRVDGAIPPGDNLHSTSLLALDAATGALRWHHQMLPHNLWDLDASGPPVLLDMVMEGDTVPAVAHAGKTGWVHFLERRTGRPIRRSQALMPQENLFPGPTREGVRTSPGTFGGANWPPPAFSPRAGLLYVLASYVPMVYTLDSAPRRMKKGILPSHTRWVRLPAKVHFGTVSAVDPADGRIRWQRRVPQPLLNGGALATGGELVFFGDEDGWLSALDARTGETRWRHRVDERALGPPVSYVVDGRQRIAVTSRRGVTVFGLPER
jgi:alcohol dehydrogenase (cytochrome c)